MSKPTTCAKWGGLKSQQRVDSPALLLMAASGFIFSSPLEPFLAFFLFFSFFAVAATVAILFQRCANVPTDETAWQELFERFQHAVDTTIYNLIGSPPNGHHAHLYKDIMQSFYVRLTENDRRALHAFRGTTEAEARVYLCRIAASIAIAVLQKEPPPCVSLEEPTADSREGLIDAAALNEEYLVLRASIDACLEKVVHGRNRERKILMFKLFIYHGLSAAQIAAIPGFDERSPHALEELFSRIRAKVRKCLEKK